MSDEAIEVGEFERLCMLEKREMIELILLQEKLEVALEKRVFLELEEF